jgi:hypothetical protein
VDEMQQMVIAQRRLDMERDKQKELEKLAK